MKPEQIFEMTEHISADYITEAKPKKLRTGEVIPAADTWHETAPEQIADSRSGKILHYITTGFAAAAALALVIGGGMLISRMNKPNIADSGQSGESSLNSTNDSRADSAVDSRQESAVTEPLTGGYAAGREAAQNDFAAGKAEITLDGKMAVMINKIYKDSNTVVMMPFQSDAISAVLPAEIIAQMKEGEAYTLVFDNAAFTAAVPELLWSDGYFDAMLMHNANAALLPVSSVHTPQDGEYGLDCDTLRWSKPTQGDAAYAAEFRRGYDAVLSENRADREVELNGSYTATILELLPRYGGTDEIGAAMVTVKGLAEQPVYLTLPSTVFASGLTAGKTYTFTISGSRASVRWEGEETEMPAPSYLLFSGIGYSLADSVHEATTEELAQDAWRVTASRQTRTEKEQQSLDAKRGSFSSAEYRRDSKNLYFENETVYAPYAGVGDMLTRVQRTTVLPPEYYALSDGEQLFTFDEGKICRAGESKPVATIDPVALGITADTLTVQQEIPAAIAHVSGDWYFLVMDYVDNGALNGKFMFWFDIKTGQVIVANDTGLFLGSDLLYPAADGKGVYAQSRDTFYYFAVPGEGSNKTYSIAEAQIDPSLPLFNGTDCNWALCGSKLYWFCIKDGQLHTLDTATGAQSVLKTQEPIISLSGFGGRLFGISENDTSVLLEIDPANGNTKHLVDLSARIGKITSLKGGITAEMKNTIAETAQFAGIEAIWDDMLLAKLNGDMFALYQFTDDSLMILCGDQAPDAMPISGKVRSKTEQAAYELDTYDKNPAYYSTDSYEWTEAGLAAMKALWQRTAAELGSDTDTLKSLVTLTCTTASSNGNVTIAAQQTLEELIGVEVSGMDWGYVGPQEFSAALNTAVYGTDKVSAEVAAYIRELAIAANS